MLTPPHLSRRTPLLRFAHRSERGAVLIHVAIAMIGLMGFSAFVIDYGILWSARRQAQNAADTAALAAATSLGYIDADDQARARSAAVAAGTDSWVWGESPVVPPDEVTFDPCPPDAPPDGLCVRVNVYRDQAHNNPLPTIFGQLVGIMDHGARATATAEVRFGLSTTCVKPIAIPDKWLEFNPTEGEWTPDSQFNRYAKGVLLTPADVFEQRVGTYPGSGYDLTPGSEGSDYGTRLVIKPSNGNNRLEPGFYGLLRFLGYQGQDYVNEAIVGCNPTEVRVGDLIGVEPGGRPGPVASAFDQIIALDDDAKWSDNEGDYGGIIDSLYGVSPRIVPIVAFNPDTWDGDPIGGPGGADPQGNSNNGPGSVVVTQLLGAFIESTQGNRITARLMPYTATGFIGAGALPGEASVINIVLVR
jgi:Flp pilus assembly protein TadG